MSVGVSQQHGAPRSDIELSDVVVFVCVARCGSLVEASRNLYLTPPTMTRRLVRLQRALGVQLYVGRRRGGVLLTPAGRDWLPHAELLLLVANDVREAAQRALVT